MHAMLAFSSIDPRRGLALLGKCSYCFEMFKLGPPPDPSTRKPAESLGARDNGPHQRAKHSRRRSASQWAALAALTPALYLTPACSASSTAGGPDDRPSAGEGAGGSTDTALSPSAGAAGHGTSVNGGSGGSGPAQTSGPVVLDGVVNFRQVGGLVAAEGLRVRQNVLFRSGELSALSSEECRQFSDLKIRTVIDLRETSDTESTPNAECTRGAAGYYNVDLPKLLPPTEENYLATLDALEPKLPQVFDALTQGAEGGLPALIHCVIGRDRASMTMALVLSALGVERDAVLEDFVENQESTVDGSWMAGVVARVENAGGIESYLDAHGVTESTLESLKALALE